MGVSGLCVCVCWMAAPLTCSPVWQQSQHSSPLQCKRPYYSCSKWEKDREEVNERGWKPSLSSCLPLPPLFPSFYLKIPVCSGKSLSLSIFPSFWLFSPLMFLPSCLSPPNVVYIARPNLHILKIFTVRESIWNSWNSYAEHNQCLIHRTVCLSCMRADPFVLLIASLRHIL